MIVAALAEEPTNVIVAIGRDQDPTLFGSQPENVRLEPYVAQPLLLEHCDALVTHGGFNSVKEALGAAVPMVVVPITADQPYSAERCAAIGVGVAIGADDRTPETIRAAVRRVLGEPSFADSARGFRAQMAALPGPGEMVAMLESVQERAAAGVSPPARIASTSSGSVRTRTLRTRSSSNSHSHAFGVSTRERSRRTRTRPVTRMRLSSSCSYSCGVSSISSQTASTSRM